MIAVVIYVMGYRGIRQPEIFTAAETLPALVGIAANNQSIDKPDTAPGMPQPEAENKQGEKYKKSALTDEQSGKILARLTRLMEKEKPYLEMGLTLPMLSKMLDVSPHHLSQVINEKLDKSYFDFVNEYRIQEAKKAFVSRESKRFSILRIAMDVGFNSKSAFYTAFKRHTGMTPSQFKERGIPRDYSRG